MSIFQRPPAIQLPHFRSGARRVLDAVVGEDCALCGASGTAVVCAACADALPRATDGIEPGEAAVFAYRFPVDRLVRRFKFAGDLALGRWLGEALAIEAARRPRPQLLLVPPSTRERLRERGFNPALEIGKTVARALSLECAVDAVTRTRETLPQPGLGRDARRRNLEGAFRCARDVRGLHVAIVDDVMTTGATVDAIGEVLRREGAGRVSAWVVARTPEPAAR